MDWPLTPFRAFAFDARTRKFGATASAEEEYAISLRKIARAAAGIVEAFTAGATIINPDAMMRAAAAYSEALGPWAVLRSGQMVKQVSTSNRRAWQTHANQIGRLLRVEMLEAPTGAVSAQLIAEQTSLIKSLPLEAAQRAQSLAREAMLGGRRADEVAQELAATGEVTLSRANTIARTEVARSNSILNQARAESVGSRRYIWRTAGDADVRESHRQMNGMICEWAHAPHLSDGTTTHPGQIYNCRCYAEPILDDSVL